MEPIFSSSVAGTHFARCSAASPPLCCLLSNGHSFARLLRCHGLIGNSELEDGSQNLAASEACRDAHLTSLITDVRKWLKRVSAC